MNSHHSNFIDLQFHLLSVKRGESESIISEFRKIFFCVVFTNSIEWAHEIREFHVWRKKSMMYIQSCCYANVNLPCLAILVVVAVVLAYKALCCCDPELLTPCQHFSSLYTRRHLIDRRICIYCQHVSIGIIRWTL